MKVESLFIDEGFGSLDSTTLNIAMDALERLHNLGRKVGVISHVQEMTERIPVQIRVSKQRSGKGKVEIIGV
jgi:exonuclease SbcC